MKMPTHVHFFQRAILTRKAGHTNLVLACYESSLVGLRMQDYKCLCAVVTTCATMVNIQIHIRTQARQHFDHAAYLKSSARRATEASEDESRTDATNLPLSHHHCTAAATTEEPKQLQKLLLLARVLKVQPTAIVFQSSTTIVDAWC